MYESPIEKICGEIQTQMIQEDENMVMKAIRKVGVNVDKEELIKALQYDRKQYDKGYGDGKNDALDKIKAEIIDQLYVDSLIFGELMDFREGKISADDVIEEFNRVTRLEVLQIINNYKAESEGQVDILDNIRAEINGVYRVFSEDTPKDEWAVGWNDCLDEVLDIFDKYMAESEE